MIGSNLVQSDGGKVKIHKVNLVVADGAELYAQMYIPEQASADHKLPLVIVQHGSQHNLQMQDMNMVELARRGFIVISGDAFGHGSSTPRGFVDPSMNCSGQYALSAGIRLPTIWIALTWTKLESAAIPLGAAITTTTLKYYVEQEARGLGVNKIKACLEIGYDPEYVPAYF